MFPQESLFNNIFELTLSFEVMDEFRNSLHAIELLSSNCKLSPIDPEPVHRVQPIRKLITEMTFIQPVKPFFHNILCSHLYMVPTVRSGTFLRSVIWKVILLSKWIFFLLM